MDSAPETPATDPEFVSAGREPGLEIWRIEKFKVVPWPKSLYGKFCRGDSYLVLQTSRHQGRGLQYAIHFWLGSQSSTDEQAAAAIKAVELDDFLGGRPVQYRESEGHESQQFVSLFKGRRIEYIEGGVQGGLRDAAEDEKKRREGSIRLLHVKGRRHVRVTQVPLSADSLNSGDVFVLDVPAKDIVYQFNGKQANLLEKTKTVQLIKDLVAERAATGKTKTVVIDEGKSDNVEEFWELLGSRKPIKDAAAGGEDSAADQSISSVALYRLSDTTGELKITKEAEKPYLEQKDLDSNDVFIVDCGAGSEVFVWVGSATTYDERKNAMTYAMKFLKENGRSEDTQIIKVLEGHETSWFKSKFASWHSAPLVDDYTSIGRGKVAKVERTEFDSARLLVRKKTEDLSGPNDGGSGKTKIWRIVNFEKVEVPVSEYGQFYAGDSYVIDYEYGVGQHIIYFWQGRDSSVDEKGAAALWAKQLDDQLGGGAVQARVTMNKEPEHFLSIFKGRMVVHLGGVPSAMASTSPEEGPASKEEAATGKEEVTTDKDKESAGKEEAATDKDKELASKAKAATAKDQETAGKEEATAGKDKESAGTEEAATGKVKESAGKEEATPDKDSGSATKDDVSAGKCDVSAGKEEAPALAVDAASAGKVDVAAALPMASSGGKGHLYHVRGFSDVTVRAVEVEPLTKSLNSEDAFVLLTANTAFAWYGLGSNQSERQVAVNIANLLKGEREVVEVHEGGEPDGWWTALEGAKDGYAALRTPLDEALEPRLFHCSDASGNFKAEEVFNFAQEDLVEEDVFILDTWTEVFVWIGSKSNSAEKKEAVEAAEKYVQLVTQGRPRGCVQIVQSGREPPSFTSHFLGWTSARTQAFSDPYEAKLQRLGSFKLPPSTDPPAPSPKTTTTTTDPTKTLPTDAPNRQTAESNRQVSPPRLVRLRSGAGSAPPCSDLRPYCPGALPPEVAGKSEDYGSFKSRLKPVARPDAAKPADLAPSQSPTPAADPAAVARSLRHVASPATEAGTDGTAGQASTNGERPVPGGVMGAVGVAGERGGMYRNSSLGSIKKSDSGAKWYVPSGPKEDLSSLRNKLKRTDSAAAHEVKQVAATEGSADASAAAAAAVRAKLKPTTLAAGSTEASAEPSDEAAAVRAKLKRTECAMTHEGKQATLPAGSSEASDEAAAAKSRLKRTESATANEVNEVVAASCAPVPAPLVEASPAASG